MEDEIALKDVPLTPGGVNHDFKKVRQYNYVRVDPILSWKTLTLMGGDNSSVEEETEDVTEHKSLTKEDIDELLSSPMIEVRKKRPASLVEAKFNPVIKDVVDTSIGWYKNYEKSKRKTIAVLRRLSISPAHKSTRKSLPVLRGSALNATSETENVPPNEYVILPIENSFKQQLALLMTSVDESRPLLDNEYSRLTVAIMDWKHILQTETGIPLEEQGSIQSTVGRTRILLDKRFKATFDVLNKAEIFANNDGEIVNESDKEYKPDDVYAFVDLLINEITNIELEFKRLLNLRENNWTKEDIKQAAVKKKFVAKTKVKSNVKSRLDIVSLRKKFANVEHVDTVTVESGRISSGQDASFVSDAHSVSFSKTGSPTLKTLRKTIRSNCVIKSATGTPVHCDTPRPRRSVSSIKQESGSKKRVIETDNFTMPLVQPKRARRSRF